MFSRCSFVVYTENIRIELEALSISNYAKLRYSGVGISFDRFYLYSNGARPVIYEEKETAKKLLGFNEDEYWRIVNFQLERTDPYVEGLLGGHLSQ